MKKQKAAACMAVLGALLAAPSGSRAQSAGGGAPATAPAADVGALAEEIVVLQAVKPLKLTAEQLTAVTAAVAQAQERLAGQAQAGWRALAALREPTLRARRQLIPQDVDLNDPQLGPTLLADQAVTNAQKAAEQNQVSLLDELTTTLRKQLDTLLTPAQTASITAQGSAIVTAERAEQERQRAQRLQQFQQAAAARGFAPGGPGGANGGGRWGRGGPQGMLDRMRSMNPDQYQRMSRGIASRFGDEGTPAYENAVAMMDQIRGMPDDQFQQQRAGLAQQFATGMANAQSAANPAAAISADHACDAWIQRYLLSPQAPAAFKDLTAAGSQDKGQG